MGIATINPAAGETLETFEPLSEGALDEKIARASAAWASYRLTAPEQRAGWLLAAAEALEADADSVAELVTTEMGKALVSSKAEVGKSVRGLRVRRARATPSSSCRQPTWIGPPTWP